MKQLYECYQWFCRGCGAKAWEARVPATADVSQYRPASPCGRCGSMLGFRREKKEAA